MAVYEPHSIMNGACQKRFHVAPLASFASSVNAHPEGAPRPQNGLSTVDILSLKYLLGVALTHSAGGSRGVGR
jgi:hypothetical protein